MTTSRNAWALAVLAAVVTIVATMDTGRAAITYSDYDIRGVYRITFTGLSVPDLSPESGIGVLVADGLGGITGTEAFNLGGHVCTNVAIAGTYSVGANGMGTMSADFTSPAPGCSGHFDLGLLVLKGGDIVKAFGAGSGFVTLSEDWFRE